MSNDPFSTPSESANYDDFRIQDADGKLVLVKPTDYLDGDRKVETVHGEKDVVVADVVVIDRDAPASSELHKGTYIFPGGLVGALKRKVGGMVLGTVGKGTAGTKGYAAPWVLQDPSEADKKAAREYLTSITPDFD